MALFVCSIIVALFVHKNVNASIEKQINNNFASMTEQINKDFALKSSSNAYVYTKGNTNFENIVDLGNEALPALQNQLFKGNTSGLQAYMSAIAIERIAKVDLKKKESTFWATADEFHVQWNLHLKSIPALVEAIISDNKLMPEEKVKQLVELGTPAIPFILEKIELGNEQVFPALVTLTKDTKIVATESVPNKKEWAAENKSAFTSLKQYVMDQK